MGVLSDVHKYANEKMNSFLIKVASILANELASIFIFRNRFYIVQIFMSNNFKLKKSTIVSNTIFKNNIYYFANSTMLNLYK